MIQTLAHMMEAHLADDAALAQEDSTAPHNALDAPVDADSHAATGSQEAHQARAAAARRSAGRIKVRAVELTAAPDTCDSSPDDLVRRTCHFLDSLACLPDVPPAKLTELTLAGWTQPNPDPEFPPLQPTAAELAMPMVAVIAAYQASAQQYKPWRPDTREWSSVWVLLARTDSTLRSLEMRDIDLEVRVVSKHSRCLCS